MRRILIALVGTLSALTASARQTPDQSSDAFGEVWVSAGPVTLAGTPPLEGFWDAGPGGELAASTPFHGGRLVAGGRLLPFSPEGELPSFRALLAYAGWEKPVVRFERLEAAVQGRVGNLRMTFDDASERKAGIRNESELTAGIGASVTGRLTGKTHLALTVTRERTFTRRLIDQTLVGVRLERRFTTPNWLRDFLR